MRRKVKQMLEGSGISEKRIEEVYRLIERSGRYPARMPSRYLATAIRLIHSDLEDKKGLTKVRIHISPEPTKYALGRPSVTFAVLAVDWAGLLNTCTGTLHLMGFNVAYCEAVVIDEPDRRMGLVFMEIEVADRKEFEHLLNLEDDIKSILQLVSGQKEGASRLMMTEVQRIQHYHLVFDELMKIAKKSEYRALFSEDRGEMVRFFLARTLAYITERAPKDLAHQIYANYTFVRDVKKTGKISAWVGNIQTTGGELTAISVAGFEHDLSLGDVFRVIGEVAPGYQRKYDKAFIVGASSQKHAINVMRIEIVDVKGGALSKDQQVELQEMLVEIQDEETCPGGISPGVEIIARRICPFLMQEEKQLKLPQVYMHPHTRTNIKVVVISSGPDRGHSYSLVEKINEVEGLKAGMPDPAATVKVGKAENATVQEMAILDVWVDRERFFGRTKGPQNDELILRAIEAAIKKADRIGARLRIFDKAGREFRADRSDRIAAMAARQELDPEIARQIVSRLGDRLTISPAVSDEEVFASALPGIKAVNEWRESGLKSPAITWHVAETGKKTSYSILAVAYDPKKKYVSKIVKIVTPYGLESSTVVDNVDFTLLIFRLAHQGKSLESSEIDELSASIQSAIGITTS
jgi:hypothetical protein